MNTKEKIKSVFSHAGIFILSNVIAIGIYAAIIILVALFSGSTIEILSDKNNVFNLIVYIFCAFAWIVPFYIFRFIHGMNTREIIHEYMDGCTVQDLFKREIINFLKCDIIWVVFFVIFAALIPESSPITLIIASAGIFVTYINRALGALLWGIYICAVYALCCFVFCICIKKKAEKSKH